MALQDKLGEAAELCTAVLLTHPRNARAFYVRAAVLRKEGKRKEAVEAACEAARLRPGLPSVVLAAGSLLCREKCFARALEIYETALQEDPDNARYHLGGKFAVGFGRGLAPVEVVAGVYDADEIARRGSNELEMGMPRPPLPQPRGYNMRKLVCDARCRR